MLLYYLEDIVWLTYKEINVWLFVIIEPIIFISMLGQIIFFFHLCLFLT